MARVKRNSGPTMPKQARFNLSQNRSIKVSFLPGMFAQTDVQQHKKIVMMQDHRISKVPRPSGWGTHP